MRVIHSLRGTVVSVVAIGEIMKLKTFNKITERCTREHCVEKPSFWATESEMWFWAFYYKKEGM